MKLKKCKAVGGWLVHLREEGKWAALCGHSPESKRGSKFNRAGWQSVPDDVFQLRTCKKCEKKLAQKGSVGLG